MQIPSPAKNGPRSFSSKDNQFSRSLPSAQKLDHFRLSDLIDRSSPRKPLIIGVTGGSASGKTSVCKAILENFSDTNRVVIISQDSFYKNLSPKELKLAEKQEYNFDHPNAFDWEMLRSVVSDLKDGKPANIPTYSFVTHQRESQTEIVVGADVILVEGILIMYQADIRDLMDMKIFVEEAADVRLARRILRDIKERGRDLEGVLAQYERHVKPAFEEFIQPTKKWADVIIPRGRENQVAISLIVQHIATNLAEPALTRKETPSKQTKLENTLHSSTDEFPFPLDLVTSSELKTHGKTLISH